MTAGQNEWLSDLASTNSPGVKTWSKKGSCTLTPKSKPTKLTMGTGKSCTLTLKIAKSGKYSAKTSTKTLISALYSVGQKGPGGGRIFYVDMTRAEGTQYFEVACAGWSDGRCGGDDLTDPAIALFFCFVPNAGGTNIGSGKYNTANIVAACPETVIAAEVADDLVLGGQTDWFLPSSDELNALCKWALNDSINVICNDDGGDSLSLTNGGFSTDYYWSSSVQNYYFAWIQAFSNGVYGQETGDNPHYVRPIRSF